MRGWCWWRFWVLKWQILLLLIWSWDLEKLIFDHVDIYRYDKRIKSSLPCKDTMNYFNFIFGFFFIWLHAWLYCCFPCINLPLFLFKKKIHIMERASSIFSIAHIMCHKVCLLFFLDKLCLSKTCAWPKHQTIIWAMVIKIRKRFPHYWAAIWATPSDQVQ